MKSRTKPAPSGAAKKTKSRTPLAKFTFTLVKFVLIAFIALSCALGGLVGGAVYGWLKTAPKVDYESLINSFNQTTFIYDAKGNVISKLTGSDNKDSIPVSFNQTPKFLQEAIISIEDERFMEHNGIDIQGIINAGFGYIKSFLGAGSARGGSTLTQQVIKNITGNTLVSPQRKVQEWVAAVELEKKLKKWQILEMYMNYSYFGNGCRGVQSASKKYFGKDVKDLSLAQCALLAGITNAPSKNNPFTENGRKEAKERQELILDKMLELGKIDQRQHDQAVSETMVYMEKEETAKVLNVQTYFVDQVINDVKEALMKEKNVSSSMALYMIYNGGLKIYTTQDPDIQAAMDEVYLNDEYFPIVNDKAKRLHQNPQSAMVILDPNNGQIKAIYGGYGKKEASNTLNRASGIARQPGSSIKPVAVYAPAIDMGVVTAATVIDDVAVYLRAGDESVKDKKLWEEPYPKNYDGKYDGLTTVRNALKASINVVAAKIWLDYLGPDNSLNYLRKVGIDRDEKYLSLVLGGLTKGVSPLQMAAAYVPFVHKGMYYEPTSFTVIKDKNDEIYLEKKAKYDTAYSEQTASIMADMMQEVTKGKTSTYPHGGTAAGYVTEKSIGMPVAGKTGTTSDNLDKWFVGYTPYYVAATWYGYDNESNANKIVLQSAEYNQALKIWAAVMSKVHKNLEKKQFEIAPGLVKKTICIYSGKIATPLCAADPRGNATREELFIKGTEPRDDDTCKVHVQAQVCKDSQDIWKRNLLAGPYCPESSILNKVFIQRLKPYVPVKPGEVPPLDLQYELPAGEYCTVHGAPAGYQTNYNNNGSNGNNGGNGSSNTPKETIGVTPPLEDLADPLTEEQPLE